MNFSWRSCAVALLGAFLTLNQPEAAVRLALPTKASTSDWLLEVDRQLLGRVAGAHEAALNLSHHLVTACKGASHETEMVAACAVRELLEKGPLQPTSDAASPAHNSYSSAVVDGRSTCGGLVATVLALTESLGEPVEAAVFRDHVMLAVRGRHMVLFETLEHGRRISVLEVGTKRMPPSGKPTFVPNLQFRPYYLDNLAARLAQAGDKARAEAALREAIKLAPHPARFRYNLGTLLLELGRFEEARDQLRIAIRRGWDDADAWVNRGVAEWKLGRLRDARRSFQRAIDKDPDNQRARANLRAVEMAMKPP